MASLIKKWLVTGQIFNLIKKKKFFKRTTHFTKTGQSKKQVNTEGFSSGLPETCRFSLWVILSWRQWRPSSLAHKSDCQRPVYMAGQTSNYWTSALTVLQTTFLSSEASGSLSHSITQDAIHTPFALSVSEPLTYVGFWFSHVCEFPVRTYVIKFGSFSY